MFIKCFYFLILFMVSNAAKLTQPRLNVYNESHLELTWKYAQDDETVKQFMIITTTSVNLLGKNNKITSNPNKIISYNVTTDTYKAYFPYDEGVRYKLEIQTCVDNAECKYPTFLYINTPINLDLKVGECKDNNLPVFWNETKLKGIDYVKYVCTATKGVSDILNLNIFPNTIHKFAQPCKILDNHVNCSQLYFTIIGVIKSHKNIFSLRFNNITSERPQCICDECPEQKDSKPDCIIWIIVTIIAAIVTILVCTANIICYLRK